VEIIGILCWSGRVLAGCQVSWRVWRGAVAAGRAGRGCELGAQRPVGYGSGALKLSYGLGADPEDVAQHRLVVLPEARSGG
jgi:hypothetical protein